MDQDEISVEISDEEHDISEVTNEPDAIHSVQQLPVKKATHSSRLLLSNINSTVKKSTTLHNKVPSTVPKLIIQRHDGIKPVQARSTTKLVHPQDVNHTAQRNDANQSAQRNDANQTSQLRDVGKSSTPHNVIKRTNIKRSAPVLNVRQKVQNISYSDESDGLDASDDIQDNSDESDAEHITEVDTDEKYPEDVKIKSNKGRRKILSNAKKSSIKKGPGRPRKVPKKEPMPRLGIKTKPSEPMDIVEFIYDIPIILKKIQSFFKALAASKMQILFRGTDIILYARDHYEKTEIRVKINAAKINHYYCKALLDIGIASKDLEIILNKVDKEHGSIILISTADTAQKNIMIVSENDMQIDEIHTVDLIEPYDHITDEIEKQFEDEDYTIKFRWPSKYFRKTISDIKTISSQLSIIQESVDAPLTIEYASANKKIQSRHMVKNPEKIKLESNLSGDESFRMSLKIDYIKPISSSHIADEIIIMCDENKRFMTKAEIDGGTIEIKTLTEIVDERPDD